MRVNQYLYGLRCLRWRSILLICSLVHLQANPGPDTSRAELWVCPGPDQTEVFTDHGGHGCRELKNSRPTSPEVSRSTAVTPQQRVPDIGTRFQLAQIDYEPVHKALIDRCTRSFPASALSLQTAISEWQNRNRESQRDLRLLWDKGMASFSSKAPNVVPQAATLVNMMTANLKEKIVKMPQEELEKACNGGFATTLRSAALDFFSLRQQTRGAEDKYLASLSAVFLRQGTGEAERPDLELSRRCAQDDNPSCMVQVADAILRGGNPINFQEARDWARKALSKGEARAGFYLAKAYLADPNNRFIVDGKADHTKYDALVHRTNGQRKEQIEALEALAESAQTGFVPARLLLATLLYEQSGGMPAKQVALLLNGLNDLSPVYQNLLKTAQQVLVLGPTHASPRLVTDALKTALMGALGQATRNGVNDMAECKDFKLVKVSQVTPVQDVEWLPLRHPLIANTYPVKGRWTEEWTVTLCNTPYTVHMQFQADGLGGAYHTTKVQ